jgi:hypothetical protein
LKQRKRPSVGKTSPNDPIEAGKLPSDSNEKDRSDRVGAYTAANTASPESARAKLKELGILGHDGKLAKPYQ